VADVRLPVRRTMLALLLTCAVLVVAATATGAVEPVDGAQVGSAPAALRVTAGAPVEPALARAEVRGPRGAVTRVARVTADDPEALVIPVRADGPGTYRAAWSGLTTDGHPFAGTSSFSVRARTPEAAPVVPQGNDGPGAWAIVARFLVLVGVLGTAGMTLAREWVIGGAWRGGGIRPPGGGGSAADADAVRAAAAHAAQQGPVRTWWRTWWWLLAAWALGLAVAFPVQAAAVGGEWAALLTGSRFGSAWLGLLVLLGLAAIIGAVVRRRVPSVAPGGMRTYALALPGLLGAILLSWSGHAGSGGDATLGTIIDVIHGWATALWLGGLVMLAALALPLMRRLAPVPRVRFGASVIVRFSSLAVGAVVVLVITGVYRALAELPSLSALWNTAYGVTLTVKLGIFAVMLAFAGWNRLVLHPRIERTALGLREDGGDDGVAALRASVRAEIALSVMVMVSVAVLVGIVPPT
jgi:copper transport protein